MTTIRSPVAERSINPSWVVKADTASSGISSPTRITSGTGKGMRRRYSAK